MITPADADLPRVLPHQLLVGDRVGAADLEYRAALELDVERRDQVGEHVLDRDRLRCRAHPARRDHHGQALDQLANHLEGEAARADHDRRPELDRLHARFGEDARRPPGGSQDGSRARRRPRARPGRRSGGRPPRAPRPRSSRRRGGPPPRSSPPSPSSGRGSRRSRSRAAPAAGTRRRARRRRRSSSFAVRGERLRAAGQAAHVLAPLLEHPEQPAADVAGRAGEEDGRRADPGSAGHDRATLAAAATRSPSRRRAPRRPQNSSVRRGRRARSPPSAPAGGVPAPPPAAAPGRPQSARPRSCVSAALSTVSIGVSAPRNTIRQPASRKAMPNAAGEVVLLAGRAGKHRERAGPRPQTRASPSSRPRRTLLAKCSWPMSIRPSASPPRPPKDGNYDLHHRPVGAERREPPVEQRVRRLLVIALDRREQASLRGPRAALGRPLLREHGTRGLRGRQPCSTHPSLPRLAPRRRRVEPETARRANRPQQPVATLPRAQELGLTPTRRRTRRSADARDPSPWT